MSYYVGQCKDYLCVYLCNMIGGGDNCHFILVGIGYIVDP